MGLRAHPAVAIDTVRARPDTQRAVDAIEGERPVARPPERHQLPAERNTTADDCVADPRREGGLDPTGGGVERRRRLRQLAHPGRPDAVDTADVRIPEFGLQQEDRRARTQLRRIHIGNGLASPDGPDDPAWITPRDRSPSL